MNKKDQIIADESVEQGNISEEHTLSTVTPRTLATQTAGVPIAGFNELPVSMLALPFLVIVQNGTDVYLADGETPAPKGEWYDTTTRTTMKEINFVALRAKVIQKEVMGDDGLMQKRTKLRVLIADVNDGYELKIVSLPISSFNAFGRLMAQMKKAEIVNSFEYVVKGGLVGGVNKTGKKFFVGDFIMQDKLSAKDMDEMTDKLGIYGGVLDRVDVEEGEVE